MPDCAAPAAGDPGSLHQGSAPRDRTGGGLEVTAIRSSIVLGLALLALPATALAYGTDQQELVLADRVAIMEGASYETGYLPSGSPVMVNFAIESVQEAEVEMRTLAELSWPEAVTLVWTPVEGSGWLGLFGELSTVLTLQLDLWGYSGEWELDRRSVDVVTETEFDPLVLSDSVPDSVSLSSEGEGTTAFTIDYTVLEVVTIALDVDLAATLETTMAGLEIQHDDQIQLLELEDTLLSVPYNGYLEVSSTYLASWETAMQVLIQPGVEVCVEILGCYEWDDIVDIPVDMGSASLEDPFETVTYDFLLPVMEPPDAEYDFGEIHVDTLANWNCELQNVGVEILEGQAGITGSEYFMVYPGTILADSESYDGVVVSFGPESVGEFSATLLLATNDPANPTYEVALYGVGIEDSDENATIPAEVGCGCASGSTRSSGWWLLGLLPLLVARRRH